MTRKLRVKIATEHCSCNSCHAKNYDTGEKADRKVDFILDVTIGNFCNRLCPDCLKSLAKEAANIIKESESKERNI